jgi:hypothetical protein
LAETMKHHGRLKDPVDAIADTVWSDASTRLY